MEKEKRSLLFFMLVDVVQWQNIPGRKQVAKQFTDLFDDAIYFFSYSFGGLIG